MIRDILYSASIFIVFEVLAYITFLFIRRKFLPSKSAKFSVFKGVLERLIVYLALLCSVPTIVVFFGAIKLGTRITSTEDARVSNDYFLIGNLTSMLFALMAYGTFLKLC